MLYCFLSSFVEYCFADVFFYTNAENRDGADIKVIYDFETDGMGASRIYIEGMASNNITTGIFKIENEPGADNNVIKITNKDDRLILFNNLGDDNKYYAKTFSKGLYKISFRYQWKDGSGFTISGGNTANARFAFVNYINDLSNYEAVTNGSDFMQSANYYFDYSSEMNTWNNAVNYISVSADNTYIGIASTSLNHYLFLDDIVIEKIADTEISAADTNIYNFDYGTNSDIAVGGESITGMSDGNTIPNIFSIYSSNTIQGNALRIGSKNRRVLVLNDGIDSAKLDKGVYKISFKYFFNANRTNIGGATGNADSDYSFGLGEFIGDISAYDNYTLINGNLNRWLSVDKTDWYDSAGSLKTGWQTAETTVTVYNDNSIIAFYSCGIPCYTFIDDIRIENVTRKDTSTFDFETDGMAVKGATLIDADGNSASTPNSGIFDIVSDEEGNHLEITHSDNRILLFNEFKTANTFKSGFYRITFKYKWKNELVSEGKGADSGAYFGFGELADFSEYKNIAKGSDYVSTRNKYIDFNGELDKWYYGVNVIKVSSDDSYISICVDGLHHKLQLDDIKIESVEAQENLYDFDTDEMVARGHTLKDNKGNAASTPNSGIFSVVSGIEAGCMEIGASDNRILLLNRKSNAISYNKGVYRITYKYKWKSELVGNTGKDESAYFGFGALYNFSEYANTRRGSDYIQEINKYADFTGEFDRWYEGTDYLTLNKDSSYIGICVDQLHHKLQLDDIRIERISDLGATTVIDFDNMPSKFKHNSLTNGIFVTNSAISYVEGIGIENSTALKRIENKGNGQYTYFALNNINDSFFVTKDVTYKVTVNYFIKKTGKPLTVQMCTGKERDYFTDQQIQGYKINLDNTSERWVKKTFYFTASKTGALFMGIGGGVGSEVYFDNIEITEMSNDEVVLTYYMAANDNLQFIEGRAGNKITQKPNTEFKNYNFEGWYEDIEFKTKFIGDKFPSASMTVFAKTSAKSDFVIDFTDYPWIDDNSGRKISSSVMSVENGISSDGDGYSLLMDNSKANKSNSLKHIQLGAGADTLKLEKNTEYLITFDYYVVADESIVNWISLNFGTSSHESMWEERLDFEAYSMRLFGMEREIWRKGVTIGTVEAEDINSYMRLSISIPQDTKIYIDNIHVVRIGKGYSVVGYRSPVADVPDAQILKTGTHIKLPNVVTSSNKSLAGWQDERGLNLVAGYDYEVTKSTLMDANIVTNKFTESFEDVDLGDYYMGEFGMDSDWQIYDSSAEGNFSDYVYSGKKSLHRIGKEPGNKAYSLFMNRNFEGDELGFAMVYTVSMWVKIDNPVHKLGAIKLVSNTSPDAPWIYNGNPVVVAAIADIADGEWHKISCTFSAITHYISVITPGNLSIYIDDIEVTFTPDANITKTIEFEEYIPKLLSIDGRYIVADDSNTLSTYKVIYPNDLGNETDVPILNISNILIIILISIVVIALVVSVVAIFKIKNKRRVGKFK